MLAGEIGTKSRVLLVGAGECHVVGANPGFSKHEYYLEFSVSTSPSSCLLSLFGAAFRIPASGTAQAMYHFGIVEHPLWKRISMTHLIRAR